MIYCKTTQSNSDMAIFSKGGTTYPDLLICSSLLLLALISTPLNLLVIRHNLLKPPSLPRNLLITLAVTDLIACVFLPIDFSVGTLAARDIPACTKMTFTEEFCNEFYYANMYEVNVFVRVTTGFRWLLSHTPCYVTGLLALTRFYQIKYLFRDVSGKAVGGFLAFACALTCVIFTLFVWKGAPNNKMVIVSTVLQSAWNMDPTLFEWKIGI